ncbi:hypothetical protein E4T56_gene3039 [Termitomyces sp. T112]|nr:hypothetical protein E4T56_gene3039 [Termitomyces sp. T112]KAH0586323.1 hypothetical protein H2248_007570 [Termitomyces sp. 'cryptogamus']KNZ80948.1 hypothetical protein J132_03648 [Termitomyces sp. J132]
MSFQPSYDDASAWGAALSEPADFVRDALKREKLLKDIVASQEDLRTLVARVQTVQNEVDKLTSGNATLQMYIDNLTMQMAKRR